jgi:hypothetical protein
VKPLPSHQCEQQDEATDELAACSRILSHGRCRVGWHARNEQSRVKRATTRGNVDRPQRRRQHSTPAPVTTAPTRATPRRAFMKLFFAGV